MQGGLLEPGVYELIEPLELKDDFLIARYPGTVTLRPKPTPGILIRKGLQPHGDVLIRGIRFDGWDWAIDCAHVLGPIGNLAIEDCEFLHCGRAINGWQDEPTMTRGPSIDYFKLRQCRFVGCEDSAVSVRNRFNCVLIQHNEFFDCMSPTIQVGNNFERWQDEWRDAVIRHNLLVRTWSQVQGVGILAYGVGHLIEHNEISFLFTKTNRPPNTAEGIYFKMRHGCVRHNLLFNAGGYEGSIASKGSTDGSVDPGVKSGQNRIYGNEIWHTGRVPFRPHNTSVMLRADRQTEVFENLVDGIVVIKSVAASAGSFATDNRTPARKTMKMQPALVETTEMIDGELEFPDLVSGDKWIDEY